MRALRAWALRLGELFHKDRRDRELAAELESHLEMHADENVRRGMSPEDARREAVRALGGLEQTKERVRERRGLPLVETLVQDLGYAARVLLKNRGFTLVALTVLAFGLGTSIATFSVVNTVLLRPFPYRAPERLVVMWERTEQEELPSSYRNVLDWQVQNRVFQSLAAFRGDDVVLGGEPGAAAEQSRALVVTHGFLATLGVRPARGRDFEAADDRAGATPVVILTHATWTGRFQGDPAILGRSILLNGQGATVVGVLPENFEFAPSGEMLVPVSTILHRLRDRGRDTGLLAVARLRDAVSTDRARSEMSGVMGQLVKTYPEALAGRKIVLDTLRDFRFGDLTRTLWTLMGAVGFVLLIACTNVANLLMSRAASRRREVAIRAAIGASRGRLVRQFLTESLLLSLIGGVLGLALARLLVEALVAFGPGNVPRLEDVRLDGPILAFALAVSLATGVVYGLLPALQVANPDLSTGLKDAARGTTSGRASMGAGLVIAEVALALVLLIGGALMIQTFWKLHQVDPGFDPDRLLTLQAVLPAREGEGRALRDLVDRLSARVREVPGVRDVAMADGLPYIGTNQVPIAVEGRDEQPADSPIAQMYVTTHNYFEVLGLEVVRGRTFSAADVVGAPPVAVIDEVFARKYFPGGDAIGRRLTVQTSEAGPSREIVGVVRHVKDSGLDGRGENQPQFYLAFAQIADDRFTDIAERINLVVRTAQDPLVVAPSLRREIARVDARIPVFAVQTAKSLIADTMIAQRFSVLLLSVFGVVALVLAAVGLYGLMAYHVSQREQEIGIRMALGAGTRDVFAMILRRSLGLTAIGLAIGIAAALALTRVLSNLLFDVSASDPATFAVVVVVFVVIALVASYVPARRAAQIDPLNAMRAE